MQFDFAYSKYQIKINSNWIAKQKNSSENVCSLQNHMNTY
jgi:hypothetical protein